MNRVLQGWHFMRILRLALSILIIGQAIATREWIPGLAGIFLLLLAVANIGCCGPNGCSVPGRSKTTPTETPGSPETIIFEEVKNK
ncbi:MAG TPA: hypothetical protein VLD19_03450 [Chitinophagaceae bacterium]|nr:hypothetical protein [Chitinophagaceae bacterium]